MPLYRQVVTTLYRRAHRVRCRYGFCGGVYWDSLCRFAPTGCDTHTERMWSRVVPRRWIAMRVRRARTRCRPMRALCFHSDHFIGCGYACSLRHATCHMHAMRIMHANKAYTGYPAQSLGAYVQDLGYPINNTKNMPDHVRISHTPRWRQRGAVASSPTTSKNQRRGRLPRRARIGDTRTPAKQPIHVCSVAHGPLRCTGIARDCVPRTRLAWPLLSYFRTDGSSGDTPRRVIDALRYAQQSN